MSFPSHHIVFLLVQVNTKLVVDDGNAGAHSCVNGIQFQSLVVVLQGKVQLSLLEEAV